MADASTQSSGSQRSLNPFAKQDEHSAQSILLYKITTSLSYLLLLISSIYYAIHAPAGAHSHRFWHNNHSTPFAQSSIFTSIYWLILFTLQLGYAYALYTPSTATVNFAANIGSHFIANNLLLFGFVNLFVRSHFWLAEFLLVVNFFNLTFAYFRHSKGPRWVHVGALSGPLAWNFVALYWCGALAVHSNHFAARIIANVFIWGWVGYGAFYLIAFKDYTMGFALSALAFCKSLLVLSYTALCIYGMLIWLRSYRRRPIPYSPSCPTAPVDFRLYYWRSSLSALACGRYAGPAWSRSLPPRPNC